MRTWSRLHEHLACSDGLCSALAAIMWREAIRWPNEELIAQVARTRMNLAALAGALDTHGVRLTPDAIHLAQHRDVNGLTAPIGAANAG